VNQVVAKNLNAIFVGPEFAAAIDALGSNFLHFASSDELSTYLHDFALSGYTVLVKGSRGIQMEKVVSEL